MKAARLDEDPEEVATIKEEAPRWLRNAVRSRLVEEEIQIQSQLAHDNTVSRTQIPIVSTKATSIASNTKFSSLEVNWSEWGRRHNHPDCGPVHRQPSNRLE